MKLTIKMLKTLIKEELDKYIDPDVDPDDLSYEDRLGNTKPRYDVDEPHESLQGLFNKMALYRFFKKLPPEQIKFYTKGDPEMEKLINHILRMPEVYN